MRKIRVLWAAVALALALVHHLAISNNVPLRQVAQYLSRLGRKLIIEFVPKSDSQVQRLLASGGHDQALGPLDARFLQYLIIAGVAKNVKIIVLMGVMLGVG